jgi:hypothetical protein
MVPRSGLQTRMVTGFPAVWGAETSPKKHTQVRKGKDGDGLCQPQRVFQVQRHSEALQSRVLPNG